MSFLTLLKEIETCRLCHSLLPLGARPIVQASSQSKILIIGQAPSLSVHETGIPWDDSSGDRLRLWLGMDKKEFYDSSVMAIVPMGFCYPGRAKSGDAPPRKECAPAWHARLFEEMTSVRTTLLIGQYAQNYYLKSKRKENLTETVRAWKEYLPRFIPLPHSSPLNNIWRKKHPWFEKDIVPEVREYVRKLVS